MSSVAVLGAGIVGSAAAWDLARRGHTVDLGDVTAPDEVAASVGARAIAVDASDPSSIAAFIGEYELVVSAVPYAFGMTVASAAVAGGTHYLDFGGNPAVVARQLTLDEAARAAGVAVIPDCGLAPGMANVLAVGVVEMLGEGPIDSVRLRVGALPAVPIGALGYQLAFNPAGLVNEYAEPCEVLVDGAYATVEPLTEIEDVEWDGWGPLEAFHTAGGSSSLPRMWEGRVADLNYKTLRFPGHGHVFRSVLEMGMFDESPQPGTGVAPRSVLLEALRANLPAGADDVVLVRVWATATRHGEHRTAGYQVVDRHDGRFSALARTTAFPATALADQILAGAAVPGARTMDGAISAPVLIESMVPVGIEVEEF